MRILAVSYNAPHPDKSSGELRFHTLLSLLAKDHQVLFFSTDPKTADDVESKNILQKAGVSIIAGTYERALRQEPFDMVFFEFYFVAEQLIRDTRAWQPRALIVVDSVDVHFHRLRSKAKLTESESDLTAAEDTYHREMGVYMNADAVIAVSEDDRAILVQEGLDTPVEVIPNIHLMHPIKPRHPDDCLELIFIGAYNWSPNVDAMIYFCTEVMPLLRSKIQKIRLRVVGNAPTESIKALAASDIEIVGYVPETATYLQSSHISVAPLRYGGGIKGKIGEALAHGLPVVTTSIGAEGFGFKSGLEVIIADSPEAMSDAIFRLWSDRTEYERLRTDGWNFIRSRYSVEAIGDVIAPTLTRINSLTPKKIPFLNRIKIIGPHLVERHFLWRFRT